MGDALGVMHDLTAVGLKHCRYNIDLYLHVVNIWSMNSRSLDKDGDDDVVVAVFDCETDSDRFMIDEVRRISREMRSKQQSLSDSKTLIIG